MSKINDSDQKNASVGKKKDYKHYHKHGLSDQYQANTSH